MSIETQYKSIKTQSTLPQAIKFRSNNMRRRTLTLQSQNFRYGIQGDSSFNGKISIVENKQYQHSNRRKTINDQKQIISKSIQLTDNKKHPFNTNLPFKTQQLIKQTSNNKRQRIQSIYFPKNQPFKKYRGKNNLFANKKHSNLQILQVQRKIDPISSQQQHLQTISQQLTNKRESQHSDKGKMPISLLKRYEMPIMEDMLENNQKHDILEKVNVPRKNNDISQSWIKNHYQPHLDLLKNVNINTLIFKKYSNGTYFGQLNQDGIKEGLGIIFYQNGKLFEGQFKNDVKEGQGYQLYPDGSFYIGSYEGGIKNGKGRYQWPNGQVYDGQWKCGKKHGSGIWENKNQQSSYIGQWNNGIIQGFGVLINQNGSRYEGQFFNSMKHGKGTLRLNNGDSYIGQFRKNVPNGNGQYYWSKGDYYKGEFSNGIRHGKGTQRFANGYVYTGEFRNDKKSGYGQEKFEDGATYIGNFQNNYRHGYGQLYSNGNSIYKGYWINNRSVQVSDTPIIFEDQREGVNSILELRSRQKINSKELMRQRYKSIKQLKSNPSIKQMFHNKISQEYNGKQSLNSLEKNHKRACKCLRKH